MLLSLHHDMRANRREGVSQLIEALSSHEGIDRIRIFNKPGRIAFSSRPSEVGQVVDTRAEACVKCHSGSAPPPTELDSRNRSRIYTDTDGKRVLATIHVIKNAQSCQGAACHGKISVGRLKEEHALEYERLFPEAAREAEDMEAVDGWSEPVTSATL